MAHSTDCAKCHKREGKNTSLFSFNLLIFDRSTSKGFSVANLIISSNWHVAKMKDKGERGSVSDISTLDY